MPDETKLRELLKRVSEVEGFCESGVKDVHTLSSTGDYPIHIVAIWGDVAGIKTLLEFGADINSLGEDGFTPLHEAVDQGNFEAVKFLIARGADPEIANEDGDTPLDTAKLYKNNEMIKSLSKLE